MLPVNIDINKSDRPALLAECERLGISVSATAKLSRLKAQLRAHQTEFNNRLRQRDLAERLFGADHGIDSRSALYVVQGISDLLFQRLLHEGYVHVGEVDGGGLYDANSGDTIYILARINASFVHIKRVRDGHETSNHSATIVYLARLAFQDVDRVHQEWEEAGKSKKAKRTAD